MPVTTVGSKKEPVARFAAGDNGGAALDRVLNVLLHLLDRVLVDQGAGGDAFLEPVSDLQLVHRCRQFFRKLFVDAGLHIDAVGTNTGLAVVAEFRGHGTLDRRIQICVVKDDEGRIAAQFH